MNPSKARATRTILQICCQYYPLNMKHYQHMIESMTLKAVAAEPEDPQLSIRRVASLMTEPGEGEGGGGTCGAGR